MKKTSVTLLQGEIVKTFSDKDYDNFVYEIVNPDPTLDKLHQFTFAPP